MSLMSGTCFFFNDTATTEIYTLSLHDALPISERRRSVRPLGRGRVDAGRPVHRRRRARDPAPDVRALLREGARGHGLRRLDRKSTRLNSSHANISYAVFCLKKKKKPLPRLLLK